jgi:uncharacterized protein YbaP (TraB family)
MQRREFIVAGAAGIYGLAIGRRRAAAEPILWSVERDGSGVYILGFADAKDRTWFTPTVASAFQESTDVWFETPKGPPAAGDDGGDALAKRLGTDPRRDLFDVLGPRTGPRALTVATELGIPRETLAHQRPWLAFYTINDAFRQRYHVYVEGELPDQVLAAMAIEARKAVHSEYATRTELVRFFAKLPADAQREHVEDLLDYIDDQKAGRNVAEYGWVTGQPDTAKIERMRRERPALYDVMHVRRNRAWAERIGGLLAGGGFAFVVVGMNHMLGPDGIPRCLERIGLSPKRVV